MPKLQFIPSKAITSGLTGLFPLKQRGIGMLTTMDLIILLGNNLVITGNN